MAFATDSDAATGCACRYSVARPWARRKSSTTADRFFAKSWRTVTPWKVGSFSSAPSYSAFARPWKASSPGQATNCERASALPAWSAEAPTAGCWLSLRMSLSGSSPACWSARTRVPSAADPTLVDTFLPRRPVRESSFESGAVTTVLRPPARL